MMILTHEPDHVSGGTAQYDAGHANGSAQRTAVDQFIQAGALLGFKESSQHQLIERRIVGDQGLRPASSILGFFGAGH